MTNEINEEESKAYNDFFNDEVDENFIHIIANKTEQFCLRKVKR